MLEYFDKWEKSVTAREGFDAKEKKQMMISAETREKVHILGSCAVMYPVYLISITVFTSFTEMIPYLFKLKGVDCFLSEKLSQDPQEKFFRCQRQTSRTNENPIS